MESSNSDDANEKPHLVNEAALQRYSQLRAERTRAEERRRLPQPVIARGPPNSRIPYPPQYMNTELTPPTPAVYEQRRDGGYEYVSEQEFHVVTPPLESGGSFEIGQARSSQVQNNSINYDGNQVGSLTAQAPHGGTFNNFCQQYPQPRNDMFMGYNLSQEANQAQGSNIARENINLVINNGLATGDDPLLGSHMLQGGNQFQANDQNQMEVPRPSMALGDFLDDNSPFAPGYNTFGVLWPSNVVQGANQFQAVNQNQNQYQYQHQSQHQAETSNWQQRPPTINENTAIDNAGPPGFDDIRIFPRVEESALPWTNNASLSVDYFLTMNQPQNQTEPKGGPSSWAQTLSYVGDNSLAREELVEGSRRNVNKAGPRSEAESFTWQQSSPDDDDDDTIAMSTGTRTPVNLDHEVENATPLKSKGKAPSRPPIVGRFHPYSMANRPVLHLPRSQAIITATPSSQPAAHTPEPGMSSMENRPALHLPRSQTIITATSSSQLASHNREPAMSSFITNQATASRPAPSRPAQTGPVTSHPPPPRPAPSRSMVVPMEPPYQPFTDKTPTHNLLPPPSNVQAAYRPKPKRLTRPKRKSFARWTTDLNIYKAAKLLNKRVAAKDGKEETEYLVRWAISKNYEHEDDSWTPENWIEERLVAEYESQSILGLF
ncbi:hypothetical protein B0J14DRAFT_640964 [Halenospora varia]|nr:hypothetical protein B0J14DRAFT_640964 [Halenospora varia]